MATAVLSLPEQTKNGNLVRGENTQEDEIAPPEFVCPLTMSVMRDPVMTKHGHNFERDAIYKWIARDTGLCPITRKPLRLSDIITHHSLRCKIQLWQKENDIEVQPVTELPAGEITRILGYSAFTGYPADETEHSSDDPSRIREVANASRAGSRRGMLTRLLGRRRRR